MYLADSGGDIHVSLGGLALVLGVIISAGTIAIYINRGLGRVIHSKVQPMVDGLSKEIATMQEQTNRIEERSIQLEKNHGSHVGDVPEKVDKLIPVAEDAHRLATNTNQTLALFIEEVRHQFDNVGSMLKDVAELAEDASVTSRATTAAVHSVKDYGKKTDKVLSEHLEESRKLAADMKADIDRLKNKRPPKKPAQKRSE